MEDALGHVDVDAHAQLALRLRERELDALLVRDDRDGVERRLRDLAGSAVPRAPPPAAPPRAASRRCVRSAARSRGSSAIARGTPPRSVAGGARARLPPSASRAVSRNSCDISAEKRRSCRRLAAMRSSRRSSVNASRDSSSCGSPCSKRRSRSSSLHAAACAVICSTGRNAERSSHAAAAQEMPSSTAANASEAISAVRRVCSYGARLVPTTTVP